MECLPARPQGARRRPMEVPAAALFFAVLAAHPGTAPARPRPAESLCRPPEAMLFTCRVGAKTVSICGQQKRDGAVYRYGRPGRVELEVTDLHRASTGWSGGDETQVYADTPTHRYVVYDRVVRTGFGKEGHNFPKMTQGLLVQDGGQTISSQDCAQPEGLNPPAFDQRLLEKLLPQGEYVPH